MKDKKYSNKNNAQIKYVKTKLQDKRKVIIVSECNKRGLDVDKVTKVLKQLDYDNAFNFKVFNKLSRVPKATIDWIESTNLLDQDKMQHKIEKIKDKPIFNEISPENYITIIELNMNIKYCELSEEEINFEIHKRYINRFTKFVRYKVK